MIIQRNFSKYIIFSDDTVVNALNKMSSNAVRLLFAVSESGVLEGIFTDGDFRRWLTNQETVDLNVDVSQIINKEFEFCFINENPKKIDRMLGNRILAVPLLDEHYRLQAVAIKDNQTFNLGNKIISNDTPTFIIAEIGNNHNGCLDRASELIRLAARSGADCIKFQMRDLKQLYKNAGDPNDAHSDLGAQYTIDLLTKFQLKDTELYKAFDYCIEQNVIPLCTPWDLSSLKKLENYGMSGYKIASADFTNPELITAVAKTGKPIICSTGMSTETEIIDGIRTLQELNAPFILLHCNSTYPAPFKDINLNYLNNLKKLSGGIVGYSGHERDINISMAAVALGAKIIEKHLTLNRNLEGNDHKVSLLPSEFKKMSIGIRQIEEAMGTSKARVLSQGEMMNRENLAKSLVAKTKITVGEIITEEMIEIQSPGQGLQPNRKQSLIGIKAKRNIESGDFFYLSDIGEGQVSPRNYKFNYEWGVPVRYHDILEIFSKSNPQLLEIHLSYKDLELKPEEYLLKPFKTNLVVHAPELFAGDHTLDLCSSDDTYRKRSIEELQKVIDITNGLKKFFPLAKRPCIVTNVGGFTETGHIEPEKRALLYDRLIDSTNQLNLNGIEIIPQTMPPFPWHFGGQRFHNLFVDPESIINYCKKTNMRVCLDISHSKLACNHLKISFSKFLKEIMPFAAHLHIADASGLDGEGLQIKTGEIDWNNLSQRYSKGCPKATFIPEIWQGHKNGGEGAWIALERLEKIFGNNR